MSGGLLVSFVLDTIWSISHFYPRKQDVMEKNINNLLTNVYEYV